MRLMTDPTFNRLVVELPVRHGKSTMCSYLLPAWFSMMFPDRSTILATHTAELSDEFGHRVRQCVADYGRRIAGVTLDPAFKARDHFVTHAGGHFRTSSPGSSVAGKGAHLLIGDDLVKDAASAASPGCRRKLATWFNSEAMTRLEPGGKVVLVMSRRHPDDLTGSLLSTNAELPPQDRWHRIRMQAVGDDGAALWPDRWPLSKLNDIKAGFEVAGQSYLWECLYQQNPVGDSTMLEWPEEYFTNLLCPSDAWNPGKKLMHILAVDPSKGSKDDTGDYTGLADVIVDAAKHLWVFPRLVRLTTSDVEDHVVAMCKATRYDGVLIESNGHGQTICDNVIVKAKAEGVAVPLHRHPSKIDKVVRIRMGLTPLLQQKRIHVDARSPQARLFVSQMREFPTAAHDDGPDSLNLALELINHLLGKSRQQPQKVVYAP